MVASRYASRKRTKGLKHADLISPHGQMFPDGWASSFIPGNIYGAAGAMSQYPPGFGGMQYGGMPQHGMQSGVMQPVPFQQEDPMKAFDSSKMKQGRMGHYGYLEGRGEWEGNSGALTRQSSLVRRLGICLLACKVCPQPHLARRRVPQHSRSTRLHMLHNP